MAIPKYIKADVERSLLHAYYRQVCKCESVGPDQGSSLDSPWTAVGLKGNQVWVMDFSSFYEFPEQMDQGTVNRRMQERAQVAAAEGRGYVSLFSDDRSRAAAQVVYELWCCMPPSRRLLEALATTRAGGGQVVLVLPDEVDARIRQTVLAVPKDADDQAFTHAARLIRRAFDLSGRSEKIEPEPGRRMVLRLVAHGEIIAIFCVIAIKCSMSTT